MSPLWVARLTLVALLFAIVAVSGLLLADRRRYERVLESTPLSILDVALYNACCYLSVGIPADPAVIPAPVLLAEPSVAWGLRLLAGMVFLFGVSLLLATLFMRRVIGAQDTRQGLITSGVYGFARHPIYLGIVLVSLSIPLFSRNFDGMLVFPLVLLANFLEAAVEERYDVGRRFAGEYTVYRESTRMFGPSWFWLALAGALAIALGAGLWS